MHLLGKLWLTLVMLTAHGAEMGMVGGLKPQQRPFPIHRQSLNDGAQGAVGGGWCPQLPLPFLFISLREAFLRTTHLTGLPSQDPLDYFLNILFQTAITTVNYRLLYSCCFCVCVCMWVHRCARSSGMGRSKDAPSENICPCSGLDQAHSSLNSVLGVWEPGVWVCGLDLALGLLAGL